MAMSIALIAVTGKIEEQPQMDWYRQLNSPQNRVEDTCQVFLGMRVSCANCHNHPFERISQDDYWHFAAFFARVDAMSYGTVKTVALKDEGAVSNPRTGQELTPRAFGGPEVLSEIETPVGAPGAGEVLISVRAAGTNPIDYKVYSGNMGRDPARLPMRLVMKLPVRKPNGNSRK